MRKLSQAEFSTENSTRKLESKDQAIHAAPLGAPCDGALAFAHPWPSRAQHRLHVCKMPKSMDGSV
jgi:hypothetical protein